MGGTLGAGGEYGCWRRGIGPGLILALREGLESMHAKRGDGAKMD